MFLIAVKKWNRKFISKLIDLDDTFGKRVQMHEQNSDLHEKNTLRYLIFHKRVHVYEIFVWHLKYKKKIY